MNFKQGLGLIVLILGIVLILFAMHQKNRIAQARGDIQKGSSLFPDNPMKDVVGGAMEEHIAQYDAPVMWCLIGGIALVIVGGTTTFCCRCSTRKK